MSKNNEVLIDAVTGTRGTILFSTNVGRVVTHTIRTANYDTIKMTQEQLDGVKSERLQAEQKRKEAKKKKVNMVKN